LTPENVAEAVRKVQPFGVESAPGKKDHTKIKTFIQTARQASLE